MVDPAAEPLPTSPRRLHPVAIVFGALGVGLRDLVFVVLIVVGTAQWWLLVVAPFLALAVATLRWWRLTWYLVDDRVVVDRGVFRRIHREVPIARIQQVEVIRSLRHQVLGVSTLRIETAGGQAGGEVDLLLAASDAAAVRAGLVARRDGRLREETGDPAVAGSPAPPTEEVLVHLGYRRLGLAGLAGPQILALPVAAVWLLAWVDDLPAALRPDLEGDRLPVVGFTGLAVLAVAIVAVWIGLAMGAGILFHHDLTLTHRDGDLSLRRGLLERREMSVPAHRVQLVRITHHPVLVPFGLVVLRIDSAGGQDTRDGTRLIVPALSPAELDRVLSVALPEAIGSPALVPAPRRALPRSLVRFGVPVLAIVAAGLTVVRPELPVIVAAVTAGLAVGVGGGWLRWRGLGAHIAGDLVVARRGAVVRTTSFVPTGKAQSARVTASYFQRRRHLATAAVDVAGQRAAPLLVDRDPAEADRLRSVVPGAAQRDEADVRAGTGGGPAGTGLGRPLPPVA